MMPICAMAKLGTSVDFMMTTMARPIRLKTLPSSSPAMICWSTCTLDS